MAKTIMKTRKAPKKIVKAMIAMKLKRSWKKMSQDEIRLAREWYLKDSTAPLDIAKRLKRDKSTITRLLVKRVPRKAQGRKPTLTPAQIDRLKSKAAELIKKADGQWQVTASMIKRSARVKGCVRVVLDALHSRGVYLHPMREKPLLTEDDVKDRRAFGDKYRGKPRSFWTSHIHMSIDVKLFKVYLSGAARKRAAKMSVRGAFREPGQGLGKAYVKPSRTLKYNTGASGARVLAGVGQQRVLVWEYLPGNKWNGQIAAKMYRTVIKKALKRAYPERTYFNVLEDNDPSGFKTTKGEEAKSESKIRIFEIPKRSPQLNVCDYALWTEINKRMRRQERNWATSKVETREAYLARLRAVALGLPKSFITASIQDMKRRSHRLWKAKGNNFEEGGRGQ